MSVINDFGIKGVIYIISIYKIYFIYTYEHYSVRKCLMTLLTRDTYDHI